MSDKNLPQPSPWNERADEDWVDSVVCYECKRPLSERRLKSLSRRLEGGPLLCARCAYGRDPWAQTLFTTRRGPVVSLSPDELERHRAEADAERADRLTRWQQLGRDAGIDPDHLSKLTVEHVIEIAHRNGSLNILRARIEDENERLNLGLIADEIEQRALDEVVKFGSTAPAPLDPERMPNVPHDFTP